MPINILMPALSPTMEKGNLTRWLKKEGDQIKSGDVIAEIETDKATMEVEAADDGVLARIVVPDGATDVPVNDVIGVIASEGEGSAAPSVEGPSAAPATQQSAPAANTAAAAHAGAPVQQTGEGATARSPKAFKNGARLFASPLARRIAKQGNIDLAKVSGSGPHGRIIERDVKAALAKSPQAPARPAPALAATATPSGPSDETIKKYYAPGSYDEIPHQMMRKAIARRLVEASQTIPHFYLTVDCRLDALLRLRAEINAAASKDKDGEPAYKISVNDFIIKALALALIRVPDANVTWTEATMLKHKTADVGVAVAIPDGLITPIIRAAESKTLSVISNEMKDFAARARLRKLLPKDYEGGSSSVSNLGMFGIQQFAAIINPPQASILAVGAGEQRVVVRDGAPAVATLMNATLSTDHRAIDGALGAQLLGAFRDLIEHPAGMLA
ncbi:pyruvate dehydrogenase complex dihydrolipoamide acetyltransferase [Methylocapsa palsarum]|uniref:Acetyltransferase component of pyruvate dehydrogenase complex n=1 Tax=Methylocapsa palsarum TaxID=1612308 RepID=A0A1I3Y8L9_9HYPH|nr:pyruvate dehydrogenase complex dihydrolipoamide acetyltransferase [Methylocapsa palsarum]SFK28165.1 pyruvate dehydrogenase E2 component (dihydrolipoamide acetyltransferase) [Methylocapsa palsarum]